MNNTPDLIIYKNVFLRNNTYGDGKIEIADDSFVSDSHLGDNVKVGRRNMILSSSLV